MIEPKLCNTSAAKHPPVTPANNTVRQELERLAYQSTTPIVGIILEGYRKIAWQRNLINLVGYVFAGLVVISIELEAQLPNPAEAILILVTFALYILAAWKSTHKRVTRGLFRRTLKVGTLVALPVVVMTSELLGVNITTVTQPVLIDAVSRGLAWWAVMLAITFIVVDQA